MLLTLPSGNRPYFGMPPPSLSTVSQHQEGEIAAGVMNLRSLDNRHPLHVLQKCCWLSQETSSPPSDDRAAHSITFERAAGHRAALLQQIAR